ncbi:MAG: META domain-containing protein [Candidatus Azobacteroides sp.]|nr:META domain-containing protein [Candidatus Azobacteroides sp.]
MKDRWISTLLILSLTLLTIECKTKNAGSEPYRFRLNDTTWDVVDINSQVIPETPERPTITIDSTATKVFGSTGCNRMNFNIELRQDQNEITFSDGITTRRACFLHPEVEQIFLENLNKVTRYTVKNDTLILWGAGKTALITLIRNSKN